MKEPRKAESEVVLLPVDQVAEMLQVSTRTLWRLQSEGKIIGPVKIGRSVRWRKDQLLRWIEAGCPPCSDKSSGDC